MSLKPGEDIGEETHALDQFIRLEAGEGKAILDGVEHNIGPNSAIVIPAGTKHNIVNSPASEMKLYTARPSTATPWFTPPRPMRKPT